MCLPTRSIAITMLKASINCSLRLRVKLVASSTILKYRAGSLNQELLATRTTSNTRLATLAIRALSNINPLLQSEELSLLIVTLPLTTVGLQVLTTRSTNTTTVKLILIRSSKESKSIIDVIFSENKLIIKYVNQLVQIDLKMKAL